ncbi:MAG: hypothetical protein K1X83_09745 [Oligoflexia bacterium]|nr:hypothetical protein [Oligoflexia bacterium]
MAVKFDSEIEQLWDGDAGTVSALRQIAEAGAPEELKQKVLRTDFSALKRTRSAVTFWRIIPIPAIAAALVVFVLVWRHPAARQIELAALSDQEFEEIVDDLGAATADEQWLPSDISTL